MTALLAAAGTGCPGALEDKERFLADGAAGADGAADGAEAAPMGQAQDAGACGDIVARIFQPQCGNAGCHGALAPQEGLDLVSAGVAARVVGVSAKGCAGLLADPKNPATSALYTKLTAKPACGAQMPLAQPPLGGDDLACVLTWIADQSAP